MSKHTPGPWSWGRDYMGLYGAGEDNDVLSSAYYENMWLAHKRDEDERDANARLIASAPDLLESLVDLLADDSPENRAAARTAIAKATGEQT